MEVCIIATNSLVTKITTIQRKYKKLSKYMGVIYKLTSPSGRTYIGQTINLSYRFYQHRRSCGKGKLSRSIVKYGWNEHKKEILFVTNPMVSKDIEHILNEKEIQLIKEYDSFENGLNQSIGGRGSKGYHHSDEARMNISSKNSGKKKTAEHRQNISRGHMGLKMPRDVVERHRILVSGENCTPETRLKMRLSHLGKKQPKELIAKRVAKLIGKKRTPEQRENMRKIALARWAKIINQLCVASVLGSSSTTVLPSSSSSSVNASNIS